MQDLLNEFLTACRRRALATTTLTGYSKICRDWLGWFADTHERPAALSDWTCENAQLYLAELVATRKRQTTRRRNIATLRSWGNWIEETQKRPNPWSALKTPVNEMLRQPCPSAEEVRALFDACDRMPNRVRGAMTKAAIALMALAGLRMCEMIAVTVEDLRLSGSCRAVVIQWGKGGKAATVRLSTLACTILSDWLRVRPESACANLIYIHGDRRPDRPYTQSAFNKALASAMAIAKLDDSDITAHALRRFAATSLAQQPGASIADVQTFLRHSSPEVTLRYIKPSHAKQADFVEGILRDPAPAPVVRAVVVDNRERRPGTGKARPAWRRGG